MGTDVTVIIEYDARSQGRLSAQRHELYVSPAHESYKAAPVELDLDGFPWKRFGRISFTGRSFRKFFDGLRKLLDHS